MKTLIARATLLGIFTLGSSGVALASGDCGMNSNKPCPPPKSSVKEPAYKSLNSNKPAARRTEGAGQAAVQARGAGEPAKATLSGISASDLKVPPKADCGMNSNTPCAEEVPVSDPASVRADGDEETEAKATLSGVNPSDLKLKPKSTNTFEKEPATKP